MRRNNSSFGLVIVVGAALLMTACGDTEHGDIRAWMQESAKDLRGHVPDLPQIRPLEVKPYEPGDLISPFAVEKVVSGGLGVNAPGPNGGMPSLNPDAFPLTKAPLESIRFIGTILVNREVRALVQIEREPIRQVRVGEFMGQNHGRVLKIEASSNESMGQIVLKEKLLDNGTWVERETAFPAQDKGDSR